MTTMSSYRDIARNVIEDLHKIATQVDVPVEKVFAMKIASWEQEAERERELLAQSTQVSAEREAAAAALPFLARLAGAPRPSSMSLAPSPARWVDL